MKNLGKLVKAFGFSLPRNADRATIQDLLAAVKGADCSFAVNLAVLRSFEKAQYAPVNIGHYALASRHYCHFTSPIRRYADLLVHRLLEYYLQNRTDLAKSDTASLDLTEIGKHITFTEQQAENAEKELKTVLLLQMLSKKIGERLDCVVTGLTSFGVFVQSRKFGIEGLIQMRDLGQDFWQYDEKTLCMTGRNTGCNIRLGQAIKTRIVSVNVPARQLNLAPAEPIIKEKDINKRKTAKKKTKKAKKRRRKTKK
jgi:ribonuclease R